MTKLSQGVDLTYDEAYKAARMLLEDHTDTSDKVRLLDALAAKGETDDEILGMLDAMISSADTVKLDKHNTIDMCGTGGDGLNTFNISTTAAFVVAASGGTVAKHGNRSSSGISGSADIFEALGYNLDATSDRLDDMLCRHGICFMYAPKFHPAMKHVAAARRELGRRTIFNLLGPLANPARVQHQLIGVSSTEYLTRLPNILSHHNIQRVMTVMSDIGMDEFSTSSINHTCTLQDGQVVSSTIDPQEMGLARSEITDIQISTKEESLNAFVKVLHGSAARAMIETVALNAAGGLVVGNVCRDISEGVTIALDTIRSGKAMDLLTRFVQDTGDIERLEAVSLG